MAFDAEQFCIDYDIPYATEGKNVGVGWVGVTCPFCDDVGTHGGFNIEDGYFKCWKCGWHPLPEAIKELTQEIWPRVYEIIDRYKHPLVTQFKNRNRERPATLVLPPECGDMTERHRQYLLRRGFEPEHIIKEYDLRGTGHVGRYAFRIIIPIYFDYKLVSYEGRDITGRQDERYKACPVSQEVIPRKSIVYNADKVPGRTVVVTEGVTDVWRLGRGAVATFGITFTPAQVNLLVKRYNRIIILYDMGSDAQIQAERLAWQVSAQGREAIIYDLEGVDDAGSMSDDDARHLMKEALA